jgi:prepilin-type processing-associated H-X9-DG protein
MKIVLREARTGTGVRVARRFQALTMVELMMVVAVLAVLAVLTLQWIIRPRARGERIHCANILQAVGLTFRMFATDNEDRFPPMLGTDEGGVKELVHTGPDGAGDPAQTFRVFAAMSNELATPKVVVCSADKSRVAITNFYGMAYATPLAQGGQNASVSYFVNLDADEMQPQAILAGDRNLSTLTNARRATDYDAFFSVQQHIRPADVKPGGAYANLEFHDTIHRRQGNVALADGSVQSVTGAKLRAQILASTNVHRLIFPFVPGKNE